MVGQAAISMCRRRSRQIRQLAFGVVPASSSCGYSDTTTIIARTFVVGAALKQRRTQWQHQEDLLVVVV